MNKAKRFAKTTAFRLLLLHSKAHDLKSLQKEIPDTELEFGLTLRIRIFFDQVQEINWHI